MKNLINSVIIVCAFAVSTAQTFAKDSNIAKLAQKIVDLRLEVETLNSEYLAKKAELTNELKSKGSRVAALEVQIGQEEVRAKQAKQKIKTLKKEIAKVKVTGKDLKPLILSKLNIAKNRIEIGLPFQKEKRLKDVNEVLGKLDMDIITAEKALGRLWAHLEDELRLGRENALHRQTIFLNNEERLATIAKVGMMLMYFHTVDNIVGQVVKNTNGEYVYVEETDPAKKEHIFYLIDGLKKQIRFGEYKLPIAMN